MTTELIRTPSEILLDLIKEAAGQFVNFADAWNAVKKKGAFEGYNEKELQDMIRPLLKERLTNNQIRYLFNVEEYKDRSKEQHTKHKNANIHSIADNNDIEQSKNDHGNEGTEPLYTMVKSTSGLEGTVELDPATDVMNTLEDLKRDNENLRKELHDEREILAKLSVTTADKQDANMDQLFDMLPNDDIDTFKNKNGTTLLFERLLVNFKYQKIPKLQWWVRVIK